MALASLPEWCLLQAIGIATGGVEGRLAILRPKCSTPPSEQVLLRYAGNNELAFLEAELRSLLMCKTSYVKPVQSTFDQFSHELESLCSALENTVNPALSIAKEVNSGIEDYLDPTNDDTDKHPGLWRLWICLENSWKCGENSDLNLVNGPNPKLFLVPANQASQLLVTVTRCNDLLLEMSALNDMFSIPRSNSVCTTSFSLDEQVIPVLETLFKEFSRCPSHHELLLCPSREENGYSSHPTVDLFLTCSASPIQRRETRFLPLDTRHCVREVDSLCSNIGTSRQNTLLQLILKHRGLFNITNLPSPRSETLVYSLEDLMPEGVFHRIDVANYSQKRIFSSKEKTALALRLAKCFLAFLDADRFLPTWDTQRIFLAVNGLSRLQNGQLYICFVPPFDDQVEFSNQFGDPIFLGFAKLLLEIEGGQKIDLSHRKTESAQVGKLCEHLHELQKYGRGHYAEAVRECLLPSPSPNRDEDIKTAVRRRISELIIGSLEADSMPTNISHSKRRRSSSMQESSTSAEKPSQRRKTERNNIDGHTTSMMFEPDCSKFTKKARVEPMAPDGSSDGLTEPGSEQLQSFFENADSFVHGSVLLSSTEQTATTKWLDTFKRLRQEALPKGCQPTIRIAVLDTGYKPDLSQKARISRKVQKRWKDFLGVSTLSKTAVAGSTAMEVDKPGINPILPITEAVDEDADLHGTCIVNLLYDLLPDSEIYVGRVSKDASGLAKASKDIAAAITHAADPHGWNADIITMSFGSTSRSKDIEDAISSAQTLRNGRVLFFAAAGNDGGNCSELYPAALEPVISVRGTYGTSGFIDRYDPDPQPDGEGRPLFGTLAYRVPCGPNDEEVSGCSIAAPILAATAAVFIEFAESYTKRKEWTEREDWKEARQRILLILKTRAGIQQLFKDIAGKANAANNRYYVAPERLFSAGHLGKRGWFYPIEGVYSKICMPE